jgi:hypothetical protein
MGSDPRLYLHDSPGGMKTHLYRGDAVRTARDADGVMDEPVTSLCGTIRSYGPFREVAGAGPAGEEPDICMTCTNIAEKNDQ